VGNLFICISIPVLIAGIVISLVVFKKPETWWALLITLGAFLFFILVSLMKRTSDKEAWLKERENNLASHMASFNKGYLAT
jgi:uncharacterized membrane protein YbhN (UPF0104 family)